MCIRDRHDAILQTSLLQLSSTETVVCKIAGSTIGVMKGVGKSGKRHACANSTTTNPIADTCTILCTMCT
eukprot:11857852-Ditylum_brightwellii.AAC.1